MQARLASSWGITACRYALRAVASPTCVAAALAALMLALWRGDIFAALVLPSAVALIAVDLSSSHGVRRRLDRAADRRAHDRRAVAWTELSGGMTEARRRQFDELRRLVADSVRRDATMAAVLELDALLDQFARQAVHHRRAVDVAGIRAVPEGLGDAPPRVVLAARRQRCSDALHRHVAQLAGQLDLLDDLVRLAVQQLELAELDAQRTSARELAGGGLVS